MKDKLQAIIEDAQDDNYSDSPRFVDAILELLAPTIEKAEAYDALGYTTAYIEPENYQEIKEKARKWDRLMSITEPLAITPLAEDWHDTWSTTCPCLPLVIGNVIVHIGGGCSFGGKEDGDANN